MWKAAPTFACKRSTILFGSADVDHKLTCELCLNFIKGPFISQTIISAVV